MYLVPRSAFTHLRVDPKSTRYKSETKMSTTGMADVSPPLATSSPTARDYQPRDAKPDSLMTSAPDPIAVIPLPLPVPFLRIPLTWPRHIPAVRIQRLANEDFTHGAVISGTEKGAKTMVISQCKTRVPGRIW
jgi:hypothetical protein